MNWKRIVFGFVWGFLIAMIIDTSGGRLYSWQHWVGLLVPIIGIFVTEKE